MGYQRGDFRHLGRSWPSRLEHACSSRFQPRCRARCVCSHALRVCRCAYVVCVRFLHTCVALRVIVLLCTRLCACVRGRCPVCEYARVVACLCVCCVMSRFCCSVSTTFILLSGFCLFSLSCLCFSPFSVLFLSFSVGFAPVSCSRSQHRPSLGNGRA